MKKYQRFVLLALSSMTSVISLGQTVKTFQGKYESGTATYSYYENENLERVYQGIFSYKSINDYKGDEEIVSGKFDMGKKNELWKYVIHYKDEKILGAINRGRKMTISGNYLNGNLSGLWNYSEVQNGTNKVLIKSSVNFIDGLPNGKYEYYDFNKVEQQGYQNQISVVGQFDENGLMHGDWNINYLIDGVKHEDTRTYSNGKLEKRVFRNLSSGEILSRDTTGSVNERFGFGYALSFWQCIDNYTCPDNLIFKLIPMGSDFKPNKNQ